MSSSAGSIAISPEDVEICLHRDGRPWVLGAGNFGKVRAAALSVQAPQRLVSCWHKWFVKESSQLWVHAMRRCIEACGGATMMWPSNS